jgi:hypothetical protein
MKAMESQPDCKKEKSPVAGIFFRGGRTFFPALRLQGT